MKLVIDIPEEIIITCMQHNMPVDCEMFARKMVLDIANGTPLPKGHGRLIDADALRKSFQKSIDECHEWAEKVKGGEMYARVSQALGTFLECSLRAKNAPTIIEADKGGET